MYALAGRQRDGLAVVQKGVKTHQDTGIGNAGGLLKLTYVSVSNCLQERCIHIANPLPVLFLLLRQPPNSDLNEFLKDVILRLIIVVDTRQLLIDGRRVHDDIGDLRQRRRCICLADCSSCIGDKLTHEVRDLGVGTACHERVGQMQARRDRLGAHRLAGARLTAKQEVPHRLARGGG